jgi:hypothetical protein
MKEAFSDVLKEIERQNEMWGVQNHSVPVWLMILAEEFGEAAMAGNELYFNGKSEEHYREELVQVAAVALQMVSALDRKLND